MKAIINMATQQYNGIKPRSGGTNALTGDLNFK